MFTRHATDRLADALSDTPVTLIHGPRQSGKSTLAEQATAAHGRKYVTLDDPLALALAKRNPMAFLNAYPAPLTIDEVQRAPELFLPIKLTIDRARVPGSYLLTGSANVLALPKLSDSLAGRMEVIDLLPLSQGEIDGEPDGFVDAAFGEDFDPVCVGFEPVELFERVVRGGYPEAVQRSARRRGEWYSNYIRTILDRDVRDLANIEALSQMPLLLSLLASRAGSPLNMAGLAADTGLAYTSLRRYISLLETIFMLRLVPAWSADKGKAFTKAPKAYLTDAGLLCHLTQMDERVLARDSLRSGLAIENFVALELAKQCANGVQRPWLLHLRTVRQLQVDFVLESRGLAVVGIVVKNAPTLHDDDADGLRFLREVAGPRFVRGVVLYLGDQKVQLDEQIVGLPVSTLWTTSAGG